MGWKLKPFSMLKKRSGFLFNWYVPNILCTQIKTSIDPSQLASIKHRKGLKNPRVAILIVF